MSKKKETEAAVETAEETETTEETNEAENVSEVAVDSAGEEEKVADSKEPAAETTESETENGEEAAVIDPAAAQETEAATAETEAKEAESDLEAELEKARQEAQRNLENWQRAAAELANFKRRKEEQLKLQRDRIKSEVLAGVISALDDMDLAFQNLPEDLDGQLVGWVEGFRLVQRKLDKILDEQNVMTISTEGNFDPNFHEAVSYEPNEEHNTDEIIEEVRKGYQIGNRVIRPALVRVAR